MKFLDQLARIEKDCPFGELARTRTAIIQEYHSALLALEATVTGRRFLAAAEALQKFEQGPPEDPREYIVEVVKAHAKWREN